MSDLLNIAYFVGGAVIGIAAGFTLYAALEGYVFKRSVIDAAEQLVKRFEDASDAVKMIGRLIDDLHRVERLIESLRSGEEVLANKLYRLGEEAEEIARHLEGIEHIVVKKFKYDIHIEVKPSEIEG